MSVDHYSRFRSPPLPNQHPATAMVLSCTPSLILESLVHASGPMVLSSTLPVERHNVHHHEFTCIRLGIGKERRGSNSWLIDTVLIFSMKGDFPSQIIMMGPYHCVERPFKGLDPSMLSLHCHIIGNCHIFVLWSIQVQIFSVLLMQILQSKNGPQKILLDTSELFSFLQGGDSSQQPVDTSNKHSQSKSARRNLKHSWTSRSSSASSSDTVKEQRSSEGQDDEDNGQPPMQPRVGQFIAEDELKTRRLACHFHVYDPPTYSARASDTRYSTCEGPGWHSLVLLKDHLVGKHVDGHRCSFCEMNLENETQLAVHFDNESCHCRGYRPTRSISDSQRQRIEHCVVDKLPYTKEAMEVIWFQIWLILFPELTSPETPWCESTLTLENHPRFLPPSAESDTETTAEGNSSYKIEEEIDIDGTHVSEPISITPCLATNTTSTTPHFHSVYEPYGDNTSIRPYLSGLVPPHSLSGRYTSTNKLPFTDNSLHQPSLIGNWGPEDLGTCIFNPENLLTEEPLSLEQSDYNDAFINEVFVDTFGTFDPQSNVCNNSQEIDLLSECELRYLLSQCPGLDVSEPVSSSDQHMNCGEATSKLSTDKQEGPPLDQDVCHNEDEAEADLGSNMNRWLQEDIFDPFEIRRRALKETLASEPDLAAFAIPLFEAQWKLEVLAMSPGAVSCTTEGGTPAQTTAPSAAAPTNKRKAPSDWKGSSLPQNEDDGGNGEEGEGGDEQPEQKRIKGSKDADCGSKYICPFYKRNPTKYCLNRDPNLSTKEQKKWAVCAGQGFKNLRHLIEDHLKKCHRTFDCPTCLQPFDDASEFACHKGDGSCDSTKLCQAPQRDGIKPQQWKDIEKITKTHTSKSYTDVMKWMEIWKIIFPDAGLPKDPWGSEIDESVQLPASVPAIESVIDDLEKLIRGWILAHPEFDFHKKTYDVLTFLLRKVLKARIVEKKLKTQDPTTFLTPRASSIASTPHSMPGSSFGGAQTPHSRYVSSSGGGMLPPASPASSSNYTSSRSGQMPTYFGPTPIPDAVPGFPNKVEQNAQRTQQTGSGYLLPQQQYPIRLPEVRQRIFAQPVTPLHGSQSYTSSEQSNPAPLLASSLNYPVMAEPPTDVYKTPHLNIASRPVSRAQSRSPNLQPQGTYDQRTNKASDPMALQQSNMAQPLPQNGESGDDLVQRVVSDLIPQMIPQMMPQIRSALGMPRQSPPAHHTSAPKGQTNRPTHQPNIHPQENPGEALSGFHAMNSNNSTSLFTKQIHQGTTMRRSESMLGGQGSTSSMQRQYSRSVGASQGSSANYYSPVPSDQFLPQSPYSGTPQMNPVLQYQALQVGQQFQMQPQLQIAPDNRDLDGIIDGNGGLMFSDENPTDWNADPGDFDMPTNDF